MKDHKEFVGIMKTLAINAGVSLEKEVLDLYYTAFKGVFSSEEFKEAAVKVLRTWTYNRMPPIAEILKHTKEKAPQIESVALVQANYIITHLQQHGSTKWPELKDPITKYLMTRRWRYSDWAASVLDSEIKWWVKEFVTSYQAHNEAYDAVQIEDVPDRIKPLIENIGGTDRV